MVLPKELEELDHIICNNVNLDLDHMQHMMLLKRN